MTATRKASRSPQFLAAWRPAELCLLAFAGLSFSPEALSQNTQAEQASLRSIQLELQGQGRDIYHALNAIDPLRNPENPPQELADALKSIGIFQQESQSQLGGGHAPSAFYQFDGLNDHEIEIFASEIGGGRFEVEGDLQPLVNRFRPDQLLALSRSLADNLGAHPDIEKALQMTERQLGQKVRDSPSEVLGTLADLNPKDLIKLASGKGVLPGLGFRNPERAIEGEGGRRYELTVPKPRGQGDIARAPAQGAAAGKPHQILSINFVEKCWEKQKSVVRISKRGSSSPVGHGTGFLIAPNFLLTNRHVIGPDEDVTNYELQFGYQEDCLLYTSDAADE